MIKKFGTLISKEEELIHSPFYGEKTREKDAVKVSLKTAAGWTPAKIWRYSPFGIEIISNKGLGLKQGGSVSVKISLAGDETEYNGLTVNALYKQGDVELAGIRTFIQNPDDYHSEPEIERRAHIRWNCSEDFLPTGTAPNPVRYNDFILFRVEDISMGGMKLITSMRNKFLGIGQRLKANISLPYVATIQLSFQIKYVNTTTSNQKEFFTMGVNFLKMDSVAVTCLGEYLLNFAKDVSLKSLKKEGFNLRAVSKWLDFSYVKNEEEYKDVLKLRYEAYKSVGKLSEDKTIEDMADKFDATSEIMIVKHSNKIVGSQRILFPNKEEETEYHRKVDFDKSELLPNIYEIADWSRLCIEDQSRGADIFYQLVSQAVLVSVQNSRRYGRLNTSNAVTLYEKCGFKATGIKYKNEMINNRETEVMIMDIHSVALGRGIMPKSWYRLFGRLIDYMLEQELIEPSYVDTARISLYKFLGKISN